MCLQFNLDMYALPFADFLFVVAAWLTPAAPSPS
jgi:hypothetical protein